MLAEANDPYRNRCPAAAAGISGSRCGASAHFDRHPGAECCQRLSDMTAKYRFTAQIIKRINLFFDMDGWYNETEADHGRD